MPTVPNTTTFTLQNVVDAVNPTTDDLNDCFSDADSAQFDPAYEGAKDRLYNFRNYGNQTTTMTVSVEYSGAYKYSIGYPNYTLAQQKSTSGSGTGFSVDILMGTLLNGSDRWYVFEVDNSTVSNNSSGYAVGDIITIHIAGMGTAGIVSDAQLKVLTI